MNALPEVGVAFKTDDALLQKLYDGTDRMEQGNVQPFMTGRKAFIEDGGCTARLRFVSNDPRQGQTSNFSTVCDKREKP